MGKHIDLLPGAGPIRAEEPSAYWLMRAAPIILRGPLDNRILHWPDRLAAARLLAVDSKALPKNEAGLKTALGPQAAQARADALSGLIYDGATYSVIYSLIDEKGEARWIEERGQRLSGPKSNAVPQGADHINAVIMEVTKPDGPDSAHVFESRYDSETGFALRSGLAEHLKYYQRFGQSAAVLRIKINNLAEIKNRFGTEAAGYYVQAIARRVKGECSEADFKARPAVDSIAVVLQDGPDIARLDYILGQIPVESPFGTVPLDCVVTALAYQPSEGVEVFLSDMLGDEDETAAAQIETLPPAPAPPSTPSFPVLESDIDANFIARALEQQRILLAFQPIVSAQSGELAHYEVLMRYKDSLGHVLSAAPLILAAERLGLIHQLDVLVLEMAKDVLARRPEIRLGLNISAATIARMDMMSAYLTLLGHLGDDAARIVIELTETMALENPQQANQFAIRLQDLGCKFAIDDFGTGYTSFQNLLNLEAQIIKIDGSFIKDIAYREQKQSYVRLVVEMAQTFGLKTVAEMIDNEQDANMCTHLGVDYLQGYYLGRPQLDI